MTAAWQASLSFSERQSAYRIAFPHLSASEAQKQSKALENEALKQASTLESYNTAVAEDIQRLQSTTKISQDAESPSEESFFNNLPAEGLTLGRYENAHHYKDGLFSTVFVARMPLGSSQAQRDMASQASAVALKVTTPSMMEAPHDSERECRLLRRAKSPNVIPLFEEFKQAGGRLVLAFPFMPYDLEQLLREGKMSEAQKKSCLRDLLTGLDHIHGVGVVHRDIKPSNVLLRTPSGPAYVADFGIAWCEDDAFSEPAAKKILDVGTTSYRPPELLFGNSSYGSSLDLWATGCVAAQVVSLGAETLFDSGDLGSELALIKSIFQSLGTPTLEVWPEAATLPDWGKMAFHKYPTKPWSELLPDASDQARDFVARMVRFESKDRMTARNARTYSS